VNCTHHPTCPGCPLLDLPYEAQLAAKWERLAEAFGLYSHLPAVPPVRGSAWTEGYRHRLKLPVEVGADRVKIGLYDRSGAEVLDTPDCPVLHPRLRQALGPLTAWMRGRRGIHSLDLRVSALTGELQAVFAVAGGDQPGGVKKLLELVPGLSSVAVSRADREGKRVLGQAAKVVAGARWIAEGVGPARYRLHPGAFFQIDPRQAEVLHGIVAGYARGARTILDLYAGVGAYGLALADGRERVVMVEELPQAVRAARESAPPNVEVIEGRAEDARFDKPFDLVILNPARRGADPALLSRLPGLARRAIYVSCGPETLARDLDVLAAHGLRVVELQPIDLFPQKIGRAHV
jgi:23S rRNA (uracil1939-C5)-methyltransferase